MKYYLSVFTFLLIIFVSAPFLSKISRNSIPSVVFAYIPCEDNSDCSEGQECRQDGRCVTDRSPTTPPAAPTSTTAPQPTTPPQQPPSGGDKTCWKSGQDSCQANCQKQVEFSCSDGSSYSNIENCCGGDDGGNNPPTTVPPTLGPGDPTNPPTPVIPACSFTSGIKLQFKHAWNPANEYTDSIQIREGEPVLVRTVAKPNGASPIAAGFEFSVNGAVLSPMSGAITELGYSTPVGITSPNVPYTGIVTVKALVPGFLLTDANCTTTGQITVVPKLTKPIIPPENMSPICNSDGWNSTFSWAKPPTDNRMDSFNLRINMMNLWMNNPPESLWFLNDASDQFIVTGNVTTKTSTIVPFRLYDGWSIQSILAGYPGTASADADAIASGNSFMCIPKYTAPTESCLDDDGNLTKECTLENWISEYRYQYGYSTNEAVSDRANPYPNLVSGENAYNAKDASNKPIELIDLLDFEALRKKLSTTIFATDAPTPNLTQTVTPNLTLTVVPTIPPSDEDPTVTPSVNLPDLKIEDMSRDSNYFKVKYCNRGSETSTQTFTIQVKNTASGSVFETNYLYPYTVPAVNTCAWTGGITCGLIGDTSCDKTITVLATADFRASVPESNESNNTFTKNFNSPTSTPSSAPLTFDKTCKPTLSSPINQTSVPAGTVNFAWSACAGATSYVYHYKTGSQEYSFISTENTKNVSGIFQPNTTYQWSVVPCDGGLVCTATHLGTQSDWFTFTYAGPTNQ